MYPVAIDKIRDPGRQELPVLDALERMFNDVRERAFERFAQRGFQAGRDLEDWLQAEREVFGCPPAELKETEGEFKLKVALPGFTGNEVKVTALAGELIVQAACEKREEEKGEVHWSEFSTRQILRRFPLPAPVDIETLTATLESGVLTVIGKKATAAVAGREQKDEKKESKAPMKVAVASA